MNGQKQKMKIEKKKASQIMSTTITINIIHSHSHSILDHLAEKKKITDLTKFVITISEYEFGPILPNWQIKPNQTESNRIQWWKLWILWKCFNSKPILPHLHRKHNSSHH